MERDDLIRNVLRISGHFALSDVQKETLKECASLLKSDGEEIMFLKQMQSRMSQNFSEEELGKIAYRTLHGIRT